MTEQEASAKNGSWKKRVNPKRAKAEQAEIDSRKGAEALFAELFGAPDAELQAQMKASLERVSAIGNAWLAAAEAAAAAGETADATASEDGR